MLFRATVERENSLDVDRGRPDRIRDSGRKLWARFTNPYWKPLAGRLAFPRGLGMMA